MKKTTLGIVTMTTFILFTGCVSKEITPSKSSKFKLVAVEKGNLTTVRKSIKMELLNNLKKRHQELYLKTIDIDNSKKAIILKDYSVNRGGFLAAQERAIRAGTISGYNLACRDKLVSGIKCEIAHNWSDYERITGRDKLPEKYVLLNKEETIKGMHTYSVWITHYDRGDKKPDSNDLIFLLTPLNNRVALLTYKNSYPDSAIRKYINQHSYTLKAISAIEKENIIKRFSKIK